MPEHDRLAALVSYRVLDTAPEPAFDDIAPLANAARTLEHRRRAGENSAAAWIARLERTVGREAAA